MKSFSGMTKEELCKSENSSPCCDRAEYLGMLLFGASVTARSVKFVTENQDVLNRYVLLGKKADMKPEIHQSAEKAVRYSAENNDGKSILQMLCDFELIEKTTGIIRYRIDMNLTENVCCRKAFIRGAFLGGGTVIDPKKNYNLEFVTPYMGLSCDMQQVLRDTGFEFKSVMRKSKYVLYLKNSEAIVDFLTYMGAFKAQMEYINIKIEKEIRNDMNRAINSETANIEKTINASVEQVRAIEKIDRLYGLDSLNKDLREIAELRLKHKNVSLSELGKMMDPPLSKSGVNHRMKKLIEMI